MQPPIFLSQAKQEFEQTIDYYESCSEGLGKQFAIEIQRSLLHITQYPHTWTLLRHGLRRYIINRFPYAILYNIDGDTVVVIAIMNTSQKPDYWTERL